MTTPTSETAVETETKEAQSVGWDEKLINDFALKCLSPMVKITIGDLPPYYAHRDRLICNSEYFARCLGSGMQESQTLEVKLDLDDDYYLPLGYFIEYVYTGNTKQPFGSRYYTIPDEVTLDDPLPINAEQEAVMAKRCTEQLPLHCKIYVIGEQLCADSFKKAACNGIQHALYCGLQYPSKPMGFSGISPQQTSNPRTWRMEKIHQGDPPQGRVPLINPGVIADALKVIYENTPHRVGDKETIGVQAREVLVKYCARCLASMRKSKKFMDVMFENREIFDEIIGFLPSGYKKPS